MYNGLKEIINESKTVVFFGGAGVSTESQIPDFRSSDGLFRQKYIYPPEFMLSHTFFVNNTEEFYCFYKEKMVFKDAKPNMAHKALAALEASGHLLGVITQNIDGLHQAAGSKNVLELHGSVHRNYCTVCDRFFSLDYILETQGVPRCECGGVVKPDVVLYEEPLNAETVDTAIELIKKADVLIVGGTSLNVYPAAGMIDVFNGKHLILINKTQTSADDRASFVIHRPIGEVLGEVMNIK
jgi:NAD-dependent deacetylase